MISGYLDIFQDYLDSTSEVINHLGDNPSMDQYQYGFLSDGDPNTYIEPTVSYGSYSFLYKRPNVYPDQIDFYYDGTGDTDFKLYINDVLVGSGTSAGPGSPAGSTGFVNAFSFSLTEAQQKTINGIDITRGNYSLVKNKGEIQLADTGARLTDFDLAFLNSSDKAINNSETPLNSPVYNYPSEFFPWATSIGQTSGTLSDVPEILGVPTSGTNVDDNYITFSGNYFQGDISNIVGDFFKVKFSDINTNELSSFDKMVLRVRANNELFSGNHRPLLRAEVYNDYLDGNIYWPNTNSESPIMRGEADQVVGSGGFANYDINFRFLDPYTEDSDGYNYYDNFNSVSLVNGSTINITGMTSGMNISALELISYTETDNNLTFHTLGNVGYCNKSIRLDDSSSSSTIVTSVYRDLFNGGYTYFPEGSGDKSTLINSSGPVNHLRYYKNGSYTDFDFDYYHQNYGYGTSRLERGYAFVSEPTAYVDFNGQPDLTQDFSLYFDIVGSGRDDLHTNQNDDFVVFAHSTPTLEEILYYYDASHGIYRIIVQENIVGREMIGPEPNNGPILFICRENDSDPGLYDFLVYQNNSSYGSLTGLDRKVSTSSRSTFFYNPNNLAISGIYGYLHGVAVGSSGLSTDDHQKFIDAQYNIGSKLDGSGYIERKFSNVTNEFFDAVTVANRDLTDVHEEFFEYNLPIKNSYNRVDSNPSGIYIQLKTDNFSTRDVIVKGTYEVFADGADNDLAIYCSGLLPSGSDQITNLYPYYSNDVPVTKNNYSSERLNVQFSAPGSGTYDMDLKIKKADVFFDAWCIPFTGIDSVEFYTNGNQGTYLDFDMYLASKIQSGQVDFFTNGLISGDSTVNMFLNSAAPISGELDMYVDGRVYEFEEINLFTKVGTPTLNSGIMNMSLPSYSGSGGELFNALDFYVNSDLNFDSSINLYTKSQESGSSDINMFIYQENAEANLFDMFLYNQHSGVNNDINMYMPVPYTTTSGSLNMFMAREANGLYHTFFMSTEGKSSGNNDINMFLNSASGITKELDMYIKGSGTDSNSINLYSHGF